MSANNIVTSEPGEAPAQTESYDKNTSTPLLLLPITSHNSSDGQQTTQMIYFKLENISLFQCVKSRSIHSFILQKHDLLFYVCSFSLDFCFLFAKVLSVLSLKKDRPLKFVVPSIVGPKALADLEKAGAQVIVNGENWEESTQFARINFEKNFMDYTNETYYGSAILEELEKQIENFRTTIGCIICPLGSGSLFTAVANSLKESNIQSNLSNKVPIIAVEREKNSWLSESLEKDKADIIINKNKTTINKKALAICYHYPVISIAVCEAMSYKAQKRFLEETGMSISTESAACVSIIHTGQVNEMIITDVSPAKKILIIIDSKNNKSNHSNETTNEVVVRCENETYLKMNL